MAEQLPAVPNTKVQIEFNQIKKFKINGPVGSVFRLKYYYTMLGIINSCMYIEDALRRVDREQFKVQCIFLSVG